jgi:hypothetical protein
VLPFEQIDLIRAARSAAHAGRGLWRRRDLSEAFEAVIRVAEAVEMYAREPSITQHGAWRKLLADGAIIGLAGAVQSWSLDL